MKKLIIILIFSFIVAGCAAPKKPNTPTMVLPKGTEIPCPGVQPKGVSVGMDAYFSIDGKIWSVPVFADPVTGSTVNGDLFHHIRVKLDNGPKCAPESAWWQITAPDGLVGWVQIGSKMDINGSNYSTSLLPFTGDAVQREVPENRKLEAQVRYILADISLGGEDVLKYYKDQAAAEPDNPDLEPARISLEILQQAEKSNIVANPSAFERKPLRGGTSVVDAGTEFVQPGLDIRIMPCDAPNLVVIACNKISR
jgi:hypothetical protein